MIVVTGEYGQLGNRLIVFANMIAAAREHGLRVANPAFHEYAAYFEGTRHDPLCRYPLTRTWLPGGTWWPRLLHRALTRGQRFMRTLHSRTGLMPWVRVRSIGWLRSCNLDSPEFVALARRPGLLLAKGWLFRARQSFVKHGDEVRRVLTPSAPHRERVAALIAELRRRADVVVGVHVRQGDYRTFLRGRFYFELEQYAAWMRHMGALLGPRRVAFLVCSNAAPAPGALAGLDVTSGPGHVVEDLYALAACDHLIGPPSTYTMWASFYGRVPLYVATGRRDFTLDDFVVFQTLERSPREYAAQTARIATARGADAPFEKQDLVPAGRDE